jgi:hypothetical protein
VTPGTRITVAIAVDRLNELLPLARRQAGLPAELAAVHRAVLRSLYDTGRPPARDALAALLTSCSVEEALARLGAEDLIVLSKDGRDAVGAYPMTSESTPHRLVLPGRTVNAMCAVDALSVATMFGGAVEIRSLCRVSREPVLIRQSEDRVIEAAPATVLVGVNWRKPCGRHAAHSLCVEMVFLKDAATAQAWHGGDLANHSLFELPEAIEFGKRFFRPLVATA